MTNPNMVIFHEPDMLEFAVDGESLGAHQTTIAKEFMEALRLNGKETRAAAIVAKFNLLNETLS